MTTNGREETFQVSLLSHLALVNGLLARDRPPTRVIWVSTGPTTPGMPDPREDDVQTIARRGMGTDDNVGRRRYTPRSC